MNGFSTSLGNGRWRVRWRDQGGNRSRTFDSKKDADKWLAHVRSATAFNQQPLASTQSPLLFTIAEEWWQRKNTHLAQRTKIVYEAALHIHLRPLLKRPLDRITVGDVEVLLNSLPQPTAVKVRTVLNQIFTHALKHEYVLRNPVPLADMRHKARGAGNMPLPTSDEVEVIAKAAGDHYGPLVLAAAYSGLRFGELAGLRAEHVNLADQTIRVLQQWNHVTRQVTAPKTISSVRTVIFADKLAPVLSERVSDGLVFPSELGHYMHYNNFRQRIWKQAVEQTGWHDLAFHDLRHVYASLLIRGGVNVAKVAQLLGHSSPQTTLRIYSGWFVDDDEYTRRVLSSI